MRLAQAGRPKLSMPPLRRMPAARSSRPASNSSSGISSPTLDALDEPEIGGGEQADVVGVLPVDALEASRDDQPDAGEFFGGGLCSREEPLP